MNVVLDKRITIEQRIDAQNGSGEMIPTWSTFAVVFAGIDPIRGTERIQSSQIEAQATTQITIRYLADIDPKMRIQYVGRTFQIQAILNVRERNEYLQLACIEGQ